VWALWQLHEWVLLITFKLWYGSAYLVYHFDRRQHRGDAKSGTLEHGFITFGV
jgi:hypothetical protein